MALCKSCAAAIDFVKLESGKYHPVEGDEFLAEEAAIGDVLVTNCGKVLKVTEQNRHRGMKGRVSHFATCPQVNQHRK